MTSKLQVTIPKAIADAHGIRPGAELIFESAGDVIRVRPVQRSRRSPARARSARLAAFDEGTKRQAERERQLRRDDASVFTSADDRGWRREELYDRGLPR